MRAIGAKLKAAKQEQAHQRAQDKRERRLAERNDTRPGIGRPTDDAPWLPEMCAIVEVFKLATRSRQPRRSFNGTGSLKRRCCVPNTHAFDNSNNTITEEETT